MGEIPSQPNPEEMLRRALDRLIETYLPDDKEFLEDMDEPDQLGYIYGRLLEGNEDPDEILAEFGITEKNDEV